MDNDDKFKDRKARIVKILMESQHMMDNSKYGEFIIQTNEVQFYLVGLVFLRAYKFNEKLLKHLEGLTFGRLIEIFRFCLRTQTESELLEPLKKYNESRNALAHRMFTKGKLTMKECELSLNLGRVILEAMTDIYKKYKISLAQFKTK